MNTSIAPKRAVIYLRVSTNDQVQTDYDADGFSIRAQREACRRKASELGAEVVDEYCDRGESAKTADRPDLQRMLARLRSESDVDLVIVHKVDRLARSREDDMAIVIAIRKAGAQLVSATENIDATPQGKLLHGIMATIAEFYSANLASESKKGMRQKVLSGGTPSLAPLGYLNIRERIDGGKEIRTIAVDPDKAHHIQWTFDAYASGNWSMPEIAKALNERGLRTRGIHGRHGKDVHTTHVEGILKNPYYCGVVVYEGVEYPGRHTPLVDRETFEKVQAIRESRAKSKEKIHKHPHYLKGSIACGQCGDRLGVMNANGNGGKYPYFYCLGRGKRRTDCLFRAVLIDQVEHGVEKLWQRVHLAERRVGEIRSAVEHQLNRTFELSGKELVRQERVMASLEKQRDKAKEAYYADAMSLDDFRAEQKRLVREEEIAKKIMAQCRLEEGELRQAVDDALALFADARELYRQAPSTIRRQLNQAVFSTFRVHERGEVRADLQEPFQVLLGSQEKGVGQEPSDSGEERDQGAKRPAVEAELAEAGEGGQMFSRALQAAWEGTVEAESKNRVPLWERGSNFSYVVGPAGYELDQLASAAVVGRSGQAG